MDSFILGCNMYNTVQISGIRGMNAGVSSVPPFATECPQKPNLLSIAHKNLIYSLFGSNWRRNQWKKTWSKTADSNDHLVQKQFGCAIGSDRILNTQC